jgi:GNAT superfamily N-acetyltransferase
MNHWEPLEGVAYHIFVTLGNHRIAVSPDQQGRGLGKQLVKWLENKLEEKHGRVLIIETSSQEKFNATRKFYLNMHYQESVCIADFYKPGDDCIIYTKYLEQTGSLKQNG